MRCSSLFQFFFSLTLLGVTFCRNCILCQTRFGFMHYLPANITNAVYTNQPSPPLPCLFKKSQENTSSTCSTQRGQAHPPPRPAPCHPFMAKTECHGRGTSTDLSLAGPAGLKDEQRIFATCWTESLPLPFKTSLPKLLQILFHLSC